MKSVKYIIEELANTHIYELEKNIERYYGLQECVYFTIEKRYGKNYEDIIYYCLKNANYKCSIESEDDNNIRLKIFISK